MRIVIAPDSFKGSLSASAAAQAIAAGLRRVWPDAELRLHPMADGGEGTLDAVAAVLPVQWQQGDVTDLQGRPWAARWLTLADGTAVLESATVVGLAQIGDSPVARRSSYGLGQLLLAALDRGCPRVLIGLGGTGCNDGGMGFLLALGARLLDADGRLLPPALASLARLERVELGGLDDRLARTALQVLADVASPLAGPHGATAVFGPQKGVQPDEIARFDGWLALLGVLGDAARGGNLRDLPGSGAAGGLGWALRLLGASLQPGAELLADLQGLDASLTGADWLITGEGRTDAQTTLGKVPWRLAGRAQARGVPTLLLSGQVAAEVVPLMAQRCRCCLALVDGQVGVDQALREPAQLLAQRAEAWARSLAGEH